MYLLTKFDLKVLINATKWNIIDLDTTCGNVKILYWVK